MSSTAFHTKDDVRRYVAAFSANDFPVFSAFYAPNVRMVLNEQLSLDGGPEAIVEFFKQTRQSINEHLDVQHIVLDDQGCAVKAKATFTALVDLSDGFMSWGPPVPRGGGYRRQYVIFYSLNQEAKVTSIEAAKMGELEVFKPDN